jgi:hypothetical protein
MCQARGGGGRKGKGIASRGARKGSVYGGFGEDAPAAGGDSDEFKSDGSSDYDQASSKPAWKLAAVAKGERERTAQQLAADPADFASKLEDALEACERESKRANRAEKELAELKKEIASNGAKGGKASKKGETVRALIMGT